MELDDPMLQASDPVLLTQQSSIEDHDVFEITDFTTASDWERFVARLEEAVHEWKLSCGASGRRREFARGCRTMVPGRLMAGTWREQNCEIDLPDFRFILNYHYLEQECNEKPLPAGDVQETDDMDDDEAASRLPQALEDMMSVETNFLPRCHHLVRWFGLREFLILVPASGSDAIVKESRANLLLSSIAISLQNSTCEVPMFVQLHKRKWCMYSGLCLGSSGLTCRLDVMQLKTLPTQYCHFSGLLHLFKDKLACQQTDMPPVKVSVRLTYSLQEFSGFHSWTQPPPDFDSDVGLSENISNLHFGHLPFGACQEPIREIRLSATWPSLSEDVIVDNDSDSDLDPTEAPQWSVKVTWAEDIHGLLSTLILACSLFY